MGRWLEMVCGHSTRNAVSVRAVLADVRVGSCVVIVDYTCSIVLQFGFLARRVG